MSNLEKRINNLLKTVRSVTKKWVIKIPKTIEEFNDIKDDDSSNMVIIKAYEFL